MTFEGFDAAPLIESGRFSPELAAMAEPDAATLDAALREAARAERAATRAEALVLDLWVRPGGGFRILDLPAPAGTSAQAWAILADNDGPIVGGKDSALRAGLSEPAPKPDPKEEEILVKGSKTNTMNDGSAWVDFWGGGDIGDQVASGPSNQGSLKKVADHTKDCGTDDGAAVQVANHVMGIPIGAGPPNPTRTPGGFDWTQVEFGAVIVMNPDGTYGALNDAIYSNELSTQASLPGFAGTNAVGIWHNHPVRGGPGQQGIDLYPSSNPYGHDDWDALQALRQAVAPNDPNFNPSLWITGPDGITREFKLSERAYYESLTPEQMAAREGLDGKERTQSCG